MKRIVVRIALLGVIVASCGWWIAQADPVLDIAAVNQIGWWTQRPGAQPVGDGKFEVAHSARGDESVAALRVLIRGDITKATIVLAETDAPLSSVAPGQLRVCTTDQPWLVVDGGKWADAPKPECGQAVQLTRAADPTGAAAWSGDVTSLLAGPRSEVSLMVVPGDAQGSPLASNWFMTLTPSIAAEGTPDIAPTTTLPPVTTPPTLILPGPTPRVTTSPGAVASTATTTSLPVTPTTTASEPRRFQAAAVSKPGKPWGKLIFPLLPLAAILAFIYTFADRYMTERRTA